MNILKKAVACLAAATVMTSMAVTASAEYKAAGGKMSDDFNTIMIRGIKDNYDIAVSQFNCVAGGAIIVFANVDDQNTIKDQCEYILRWDFVVPENRMGAYICDAELEFVEKVDFSSTAGIYAFGFPRDSKYYTEFKKYDTMIVSFAGVTDDGNGNTDKQYFFDENGTPMNTTDVLDGTRVKIKWSDGSAGGDSDSTSNESTSSEPASEPVSSEPAPEPVSSEPVSSEPVPEPVSSEPAPEPVSSEPALEPVSSEPVSETVSSEPATSQPTNVDTGVTGIAAVVGAAVLAAGAVIVTRKKK